MRPGGLGEPQSHLEEGRNDGDNGEGRGGDGGGGLAVGTAVEHLLALLDDVVREAVLEKRRPEEEG